MQGQRQIATGQVQLPKLSFKGCRIAPVEQQHRSTPCHFCNIVEKRLNY
jgi:hypothetical protein